MSETLTKVKQIIRTISKSNVSDPNIGFFNVKDVDEYVSVWCSKGYEILNTHYLGEGPEGYQVLYVLVLK